MMGIAFYVVDGSSRGASRCTVVHGWRFSCDGTNRWAAGATVIASPETIERVIGTYHQAAEANRQTTSRRGSLVVLTPEVAAEVLVSADLHGNVPNFARICQIAQLSEHPDRHLVLQEVCHGGPTYPSGTGCMSHRLLEDVAALKCEFPQQVHFLLGNHELAELTDFPIVKASRILNVTFRCGLLQSYGAETERIRHAYAEFLLSCPLAVYVSNRVFVCHSAPDNVDTEPFDNSIFHRQLDMNDLGPSGAAFRLVWGRDYRQANADAFARLMDADLLLHGHEPCPSGYAIPNARQVLLDSSHVYGTCVMVPVGQDLSQQDIIQRIQRLEPS
jgi:hypothetical protein